MSRVFVAQERRLGRPVVIKILAPELAAAMSAERFEREIQLSASLQQANIVPIIAAGDLDGLPFYSVPYVDGKACALGSPVDRCPSTKRSTSCATSPKPSRMRIRESAALLGGTMDIQRVVGERSTAYLRIPVRTASE